MGLNVAPGLVKSCHRNLYLKHSSVALQHQRARSPVAAAAALQVLRALLLCFSLLIGPPGHTTAAHGKLLQLRSSKAARELLEPIMINCQEHILASASRLQKLATLCTCSRTVLLLLHRTHRDSTMTVVPQYVDEIRHCHEPDELPLHGVPQWRCLHVCASASRATREALSQTISSTLPALVFPDTRKLTK